jgi:hypothetical protein
VFALILAVLIVLLLTVLVSENHRAALAHPLTTPYQGVVLTNGQVFFGKLENLTSQSPALRDVYYIRSQVNAETKQVTNQLVRRRNEMHSPDLMVLNRAHILVVEPVHPESPLGKLIEQANRNGADAAPVSQQSTSPAERKN